jgi:hypothetical protein
VQQLHAGQPSRRAELVPGKAVTVEEGLEFVVFAKESVKHGLRSEGRSHRQVAAGQPLRQRHEIRLHPFLVASEQWEGERPREP